MPISRRSVALASAAAAAVGASLFDLRSTRGSRPSIVIRFSHVVAEDTPKGKAANFFRDLLHHETNGDVVVEVYPNSTLYRDKEELEALHMGSVEMVAPSLGKLGVLGTRDFELFDLPFLFESYAALHKVTRGPVGAELMQRVRASGLLGLAFWDNGFKQMSANRVLLEPEDFEGLRMRVQPSEVLHAQMRALGAFPESMAFSDVYAALAAGVVDGTENPTSNFLTQKIHRVQRYMTLSNHGYLGYLVLVKERFWNGLPRDVRKVARECLASATAYANDIAKGENDAALMRVRAQGTTTVSELSMDALARWKAVLVPTHADFMRRSGPKLLDSVHAAMQAPPLP